MYRCRFSQVWHYDSKINFLRDSFVTISYSNRVSPCCLLRCLWRLTFCLKPCHTDCIDKVSLQCGSSDTFQDYLSEKKLCYTGYIDLISPKDEFMDGALEHNSKRNYCFTNCIDACVSQVWDYTYHLNTPICENFVTLSVIIWYPTSLYL